MYYVYILLSCDRKRTYVGKTNDLVRRFKEHNKGYAKSSKYFGPYEILYYEKHDFRDKARTREIFFKSEKGRLEISEMIRMLD